MTAEIHVFILWESARHKETEIVTDISKQFTLLRTIAVHWSDEKFSENMSRFYGQKLPSGSQKEIQCGRGPFLLVIVEDSKPQYEERITSAGNEQVNKNMFDAKALYRSWTGGGHRIHGSNSKAEASHNLALLLGESPSHCKEQTEASTEILHKDLEGANGFTSLKHLLNILNLSTPYLVLRNFEGFPDTYTLSQHGDIDLLCHNYLEVAYILNAKKVFKQIYRRHYTVQIASDEIPFDLRGLGEQYYCKEWAASLLANRILSEKHFYRPTDTDYFYSLLYHALVHKDCFTEEYRLRLEKAGKALGIVAPDCIFNIHAAVELLKRFMSEQSYDFTEPKDISVYYNQEITQAKSISFKRRLNLLRRSARLAYRKLNPREFDAE